MSVNSKMTAIADEVRTLSGSTDKLSLDTMAIKLDDANTEVSTQADLMAQISEALEGKGIPGGGASEDLDEVLTTQEALIDELKTALENKASGGSKEEQEKTIDITENGTTEVTPDDGKVLSKVTVNTNVESDESDSPSNYITLQNGGLFRGATFSEHYEMKLKINANHSRDEGISLQQAFMSALNLHSVELILDRQPINFYINNMCNSCASITKFTISGLESVIFANCGTAFSQATNLETIDCVFDMSRKPGVAFMFNKCYALKDVRFATGTLATQISFVDSSLLSDVSIQSIIDSLADLTGTTAQTLTFHANVKAKLTQTQLDAITSKNWNLA